MQAIKIGVLDVDGDGYEKSVGSKLWDGQRSCAGGFVLSRTKSDLGVAPECDNRKNLPTYSLAEVWYLAVSPADVVSTISGG